MMVFIPVNTPVPAQLTIASPNDTIPPPPPLLPHSLIINSVFAAGMLPNNAISPLLTLLCHTGSVSPFNAHSAVEAFPCSFDLPFIINDVLRCQLHFPMTYLATDSAFPQSALLRPPWPVPLWRPCLPLSCPTSCY